jgi:hypothetical protein
MIVAKEETEEKQPDEKTRPKRTGLRCLLLLGLPLIEIFFRAAELAFSQSSLTFAAFSATALAGFFIVSLRFQTTKKTILLDFPFEYLHCLFDVIAFDRYFQTTKIPQIHLPFPLGLRFKLQNPNFYDMI